ncbi:MAG: hypothetical protein ACRCVG_00780 [Methanobacteriaceae archaeon]
MIETKTTTIKIPTDILIKIKSMAVKEGTSQNSIINELINKGLENIGKNKGKIKAQLINDTLPKPKITCKKYKSLKDMGGIVKVDEEIDVTEVIDSIHTNK